MNLRSWNFSKATLLLALFAATSFVPASSEAAPIIMNGGTVTGSNIKMTLTSTHSGSRFTNVTFKDFNGRRRVIDINGANNVIFRNCTFKNFKSTVNGEDLVAINGAKGRNISFIGCTFDRVAGDCIQMGNNASSIHDNKTWIIQGCIFKNPFVGGATGTQASENAIDIKKSNGVHVVNCTISGYRNSSKNGLSHKGASGSRGEGIVGHFSAHNATVQRCRISNCVSAISLSTTGGTANNVFVWNNILSNNQRYGIVLSGGKKVRVQHNTLVNNGFKNLGINSGTYIQMASGNNLFSGNGGFDQSFSGGWSNRQYSISAAKFRSSTDFHIRSNSPARNSSPKNITMTVDVDGQTRSGHRRDLGADEYK